VYPENQHPDRSDERLLAAKVTGDLISPPVENSLMILSCTDLEHLLLLYTNGVPVQEISLIAKSKSNGHMRFLAEMRRLMGNVNGTTAISEPSNFLSQKREWDWREHG